MTKVVTELDELMQSKENARALASIAKLFDRIDDPYRLPDTFAEWLAHYHETNGGVETYYQIPVGYGHLNLSLRFIFKKNMLIMEFVDPVGMRLMELRLHAL